MFGDSWLYTLHNKIIDTKWSWPQVPVLEMQSIPASHTWLAFYFPAITGSVENAYDASTQQNEALTL